MDSAANFGVVDYCMMAATVLASIGIGVYHGMRGNNTPEDFAMGGRSMAPLPVSLSLLASFLSSNVILGYSGEVYGHGLGFVWCILGTGMSVVLAAEVFVPIFHPLKFVSPNQYLEIRFGSRCLRLMSMAMWTVSTCLFLGLVLFVPAITLAAVTPLPVDAHIWIMGIAVTLYAAFGGLKAVVWADAFQMLLMLSGVLLILVVSCWEAGGVASVWHTAAAAGRTQALNFNMDPWTRHTVWNVTLMTFMNWGAHYSVSQTSFQRVSSVSSLKQAKRVLYYNLIGIVVFMGLVFMMSLSVFAAYADCDPLTRGLIFTKDQISVYFVNDKLKDFSGTPGVFVAAIVSAALSTLSSGVNTLTTLFWGDALSQTRCFRGSSNFVAITANKVITVLLGAMTIGLAFLASNFGGLMQASYILGGVVTGSLLGVFFLGIAVPFANKRGAIAGLCAGYGLTVWVALGGLLTSTGSVELLPLSTAGCPANATTATTAPPPISPDLLPQHSQSGLQALYSVSYTLYNSIGFVTCFIVGIVVSLVFAPQDPKLLPPELVLPCLRRFVRNSDEVAVSSVRLHPYLGQVTSGDCAALVPLPEEKAPTMNT